jgi:hypothetical protein
MSAYHKVCVAALWEGLREVPLLVSRHGHGEQLARGGRVFFLQ